MLHLNVHRLREIVRKLELGPVDNVTLVDNLTYAAAVLENLSKVESMYTAILFHVVLPVYA